MLNKPSVTAGTRGKLIFGLVLIAIGVVPIMAAFDIGPLHRGQINGPPWLGFAAGSVFVLGGVALMTGREDRQNFLSYLLLFAILAGFAAIGNWIAFGPGMRECDVGFGGFFLDSNSIASGIGCRIGFGIGAGILDGVLLMLLGRGLGKIGGPAWLAKAIDKIGVALLLITLAPILVPVFTFMIAKGLVEGFVEYRRTGKWPRNEAFILRMGRKKQPTPQTKTDDQFFKRS